MFKSLVVAGAFAAAVAATPASAALLYETTGTTGGFGPIFGSGGGLGTYPYFPQSLELKFESTSPNVATPFIRAVTTFFAEDGYAESYEWYAAPGDASWLSLGNQVEYTATATGWEMIIRANPSRCGGWDLGEFCRYSDVHSVWDAGSTPVDYKLTVSSIPEPATWAMMIVGFGAVGTMARSLRQRRLAVAPRAEA